MGALQWREGHNTPPPQSNFNQAPKTLSGKITESKLFSQIIDQTAVSRRCTLGQESLGPINSSGIARKGCSQREVLS